MFRFLVAVALLTVCIAASAQEWVERAGVEYNCDVLNGILEDYGEHELSRSAGVANTVASLIEIIFPACPPATDTATSETTTETDTSSPEALFSFSSDEDGLQPVLGPLTLPAGIYVFTATTDDYMIVKPESLSGDCGRDLKSSIFSISVGEGSQGAQSVVTAESDCSVLLEVDLVSEAWTLDIEHVILTKNPALETSDGSYSFSSDDAGVQPVLGPLSLPAGIYVFTATTDDYMIVKPESLSGDCGRDLKSSIFSISAGEGSQGAQSVVTAESDCNVLLEVDLVSEAWTLDIEKAS